MIQNANRQIRLKQRPDGIAGPDNFEQAVEPLRHEDGELLVESIYLSIDPAMRVWINENPGYVPAVEIGGVMRAGGVGRVLESRVPGFAPGDYIQGRLGWQTHPTITAEGTHKLDLSLGSVEDWIGPLGTTALTAWFGIRDVGALSADDFVLVSGAAGRAGQMAGQFAKLEGCRVVVAGGPEKCRYLTDELNFDALSTTGGRDLATAVASAFPEGVDLFFDNVGEILEAALASSTQRADRDVWADLADSGR